MTAMTTTSTSTPTQPSAAAELIADFVSTGGRLSDRADLARLACFAALPFTTGAEQIVALALVIGVANGFFRPAALAGLPNLVDEADLPRANSIIQSTDNLTWFVGPLIGGVLVAAWSIDAAYWLNAATFLVSALFLARIPAGMLASEQAISHGHWRDLAEGFDHMRVSLKQAQDELVRSERLSLFQIGLFSNRYLLAAVAFSTTLLLLTVFVIGTVGFFATGLGLLDAAYMTVTTITTVGFREITGPDVTTVQKIFTMAIIDTCTDRPDLALLLPLRRRDALFEVERRYAQNLPSIPLLFRQAVSVRPRALEGWTPTGTSTPVTWNAERWRWASTGR